MSQNNNPLIERIKREGCYLDIKELEDGTIVAIGELMFTRAIYWDCDICGWGKRFCYEDRDLATAQYALAKDGDEYPTGWIATRPEP